MTTDYGRLDRNELERAIDDADLRVLLMVLFHATGERRWLETPYAPKRDVNLIADESAGLDEAVHAEIREAALDVLCAGGAAPAIQDPGNKLMIDMMSACLGERVPPEYAPMMREEIGLNSRQVKWSNAERAKTNAAQLPVVIVGAGASGLALAANLNALGIPFIVLEKNQQVGGTWYENRYPGCGVDTPNHAYSFSFSTTYPWSRYFAPRDQIQDYLEGCADEFGVRPNIQFGTAVQSATWDANTSSWSVTVQDAKGERSLQAVALVSAIGQLSLPSIPQIEGADDFDGPIFHSAMWPAELDVTGKRVAIVGTGASSMQIVPAIVDEVADLTIYQRNAQWARPIPRYHDPIAEGAQWLLAHVPFYAAWYRFTMLWRYGDGLLPTLHKDPDWPHPERSLNRANDRHRQQMTDHIHASLNGREDLLDKCLPTYPPYGKRILLDNGWYEAITQPNVELVSTDIDRIEAGAVVTADGKRRDTDVIILATGFKVGLMAARLNVTGLEGNNLSDVWANNNPTAHLGISVPGFPNLFCMQGPNTGLGHGGSAIFQAECQSRYIAGCIVAMLEGGIKSIEVKHDVHDSYVRRVDAEHEKMIWTHPGMSTYYRNAQGRVVSVMPWRLVDYWAMTHDPDMDEYIQQSA
jgi:4-hydroxyacetophenone monooxygenase